MNFDRKIHWKKANSSKQWNYKIEYVIIHFDDQNETKKLYIYTHNKYIMHYTLLKYVGFIKISVNAEIF